MQRQEAATSDSHSHHLPDNYFNQNFLCASSTKAKRPLSNNNTITPLKMRHV
jgi:hypothetical protein